MRAKVSKTGRRREAQKEGAATQKGRTERM